MPTQHDIDSDDLAATPATDQELALAPLVRDLLAGLGEDPEREGLLKTPMRVARSLGFLTAGYAIDAVEVLRSACFEQEGDEMVIVKDIELYSLCEHHMLPFIGKAHIAYLPNGTITGLSKLARVVDVFARRLQVQERLTVQIADAIMSGLQPQGVGVVVQAKHLCMMMRGVEKQNCDTITSCMLGTFKDDPRTRAEFLNLIKSTG